MDVVAAFDNRAFSTPVGIVGASPELEDSLMDSLGGQIKPQAIVFAAAQDKTPAASSSESRLCRASSTQGLDLVSACSCGSLA